jgi:membrane associated rhomboid family serine protease
MANFRMGGLPGLPMVIKNLIIINVLVWLAELTFRDSFVDLFSLHYHQSPDFKIWQVFTYMFLHAPNMFAHILFNMFGLWMFGSTLENLWGPKRFLTFYLICGVGAGIIQMLVSYVEFSVYTDQFQNAKLSLEEYRQKAGAIYNTTILGASGAIMGIFAAFAYLFPNEQLVILPIPIPIKAKYWITGLILLDLFGGINPQYGGGVAHFAHIGGVIFGLILVITMNRKNRRNFY